MDGSTTIPSPQLLEANRRLYELRAQTQAQRQSCGLSVDQVRQAGDDLPWETTAPPAVEPTATAETIAALPEHLGWGSEALTAVLHRQWQESDNDQDWLPRLLETAAASSTAAENTQNPSANKPQSLVSNPGLADWVKLYPDIGLGMMRQGLTAPGRLWLALRYLDQEGCGVLRIDIITKHLTNKTSTLRLCCPRQLRNLLQDGEGVYWTRDKEHIWLRSTTKVAHALGVERLTGRPVTLPVAALLDGIGTFRAHLYASFHGGRVKENSRNQGSKPIARATLEQLSGATPQSQRAYERRVGVRVRPNFAIGGQATTENQQERAWQRGGAVFELTDHEGEQGQKGRRYNAWQLPNSYGCAYRQRPKGRQKRINRQLADLVIKGMPGNGEASMAKRYYSDGAQAAKGWARDQKEAVYWQQQQTRSGAGHIWQVIRG